MVQILIVEDDEALNGLVSAYISESGYDATSCYNAMDALKVMQDKAFDMIISDIMMPGMDGFAFAKKIRETDKQIPILFMTAMDDKPSKLLGYKLGIDDYVVKPFDVDVLMLHVGALLRRAKIASSKELVIGNFIMNNEEHTAYLGQEELPLTVREFDLLFKLLSFPKRTFTRSQLMDEFWDYDSSATSRTVDVYMAKLREKTTACSDFEIVTVHGLGYKAVLK